MTRNAFALRKCRIARVVVAIVLAWLPVSARSSSQNVPPGQLGPAPRVTEVDRRAAEGPSRLVEPLSLVNTSSRPAVVDLFNTVYSPSYATPNDWNGSVQGCNAGTTGAAYLSATIEMVNYFRAMTGLPPVTHEAVKNARAQQAALMMTANSSLNHFPPNTWTCYTADGAEAAGKSNLALGIAGAPSIALYIADPGAGNTALGHRRWILYPRQVELGTGSTFNANALWVIGVFGPRPATPEIIAWPPAGYVPYQVVYPRWSFSVNTGASVSFAAATISMTRDGGAVPLTVLASATGFGDNTIAWEPSVATFHAGDPDEPISVQVNNAVVGGVVKNYSYTVTIIDPANSTQPTFTDDPLVTRTTPIKRVHVIELRAAIDALRSRNGLAAFTWTDATLTAGLTTVKSAHLTEMRNALAQAYIAAGQTPPTYSTPAVIPGSTPISVAHIAELRSAALALW